MAGEIANAAPKVLGAALNSKHERDAIITSSADDPSGRASNDDANRDATTPW
jgi:hypothetical protein